MRRAAQVDGNHRLIVQVFLAHGASVQSLAPVGEGCPDLLVGYRGWNLLVEVKNPARPPAKRRLRKSQVDWLASWRGAGYVVQTPEDVAEVLRQYATPKP